MAFFDCPRGNRVTPETLVPEGTRSRTLLLDTSPRNRASQEPDGHRQEWFPGDGTDSQPGALKLECAAEHFSFYRQTVDMRTEVS